MQELVKYEAACRAIADAKAVDEVKTVMDKAVALKLYAHQAKNRDLEIDAAEIRMRAERRLGEMIVTQKETVGLNKGAAAGGKKEGPRGAYVEPRDTLPKLSDVGIDKRLSSRAQKIAAVTADKFEEMVDDWRGRVQQENERITVNLLREGDKAQRRAEKEQALAGKIAALPDQKFGVILTDPPWTFEVRSDKGLDRSASNHYPTMTIEDIANLDVPSIAADDCVLFMWATSPLLPDALAVMAEWGFTYKSHCIWVKDKIGTGYWFRSQHEILLIGTKGNVPAPAPGTQWSSIVHAPVGSHSEKPATFHEMIEHYFPTLPRLEMHCRGAPRDGWAGWGLETDNEESIYE